MTKSYFKFATLPCAVAVALLGGSVLFSCSGDDETGVDESDFSASQFETLANRRLTRSAEGNKKDTIPEKKGYAIYYDNINTSKSAHCAFATIDVSLRAQGGLPSQTQIMEIHTSVGYVAYGFSKVNVSIINTQILAYEYQVFLKINYFDVLNGEQTLWDTVVFNRPFSYIKIKDK